MKIQQKYVTALCLILVLFCGFTTATALAQPKENTIPIRSQEQVRIKASAGFIMEAETGQVLYDKKSQHKYYPASCTKILTALVALETWGDDLSKVLTVSHDAVYEIDPESSHMALEEGEKITRKQALYGLMLASANDAAVVIAEDAGGSQESFAKKMNEKAKELGMNHSHFVTPHGLYDKDHYTTAADLGKAMKAATKNKTFVKIFSAVKYTIPKTNKSKKRVLWNNHRMVKTKFFHYPGVIGGKSGYITKSGFNLVTVCKKNNMTLISVVMHGKTADNMAKDTKKLFDDGYSHYSKRKIPVDAAMVDMGSFKRIKTTFDKDSLIAIIPTSYKDDAITADVKLNDHLDLPVKKGDLIGHIMLKAGNKTIGDQPIYSKQKITWLDHRLIRIMLPVVVAAILVIVLCWLRYRWIASRKSSRRTGRKRKQK